MKPTLFSLLLFSFASVASAHLGETEAEMTVHFGKPVLRSKNSITVQGKLQELGRTFHFKQDDRNIVCDVVDGKCARISYVKAGEWTEEQVKVLLADNAQGMTWTETTKSNPKLARSWNRSDGGTAELSRITGLVMTSPAYVRTHDGAGAGTKADSDRKPRN